MLLDGLLNVSSAQALTATAISEDVVDLGPMGGNDFRDIGAGEDIHVVVQVGTVLDSAGEAATLTISVESSDVAGLSGATVHHTTTAIAEAACTAGARLLDIVLPPGQYKRYLGLRYTVGTENFTSGTINAWFTHGRYSSPSRTYKSGWNTGVN